MLRFAPVQPLLRRGSALCLEDVRHHAHAPCAAARSRRRTSPCARRASGGDEPPALPTYRGRYGVWTLTPRDVVEVWAYRASLTVVAAAFDIGAASALLPADAQRALLDPALAVGAAGLGSSLVLIHMYAAPIKRFMQALWAAGCVGCVGLAATQHVPVALFVRDHPAAVWAVGPLFAALTGLCFKEGACYGKPESALLFFAIPALLLGKLFGARDEIEASLLAAVTLLLTVFAARKYTQARRDSTLSRHRLATDSSSSHAAGSQGRYWRQKHL